MTKSLHIIYIPGLGRSDYTGQRRAVQVWQRFGVTAELFPVNWSDQESWDDKFKRLLALVDAAAASSDVALVAASAGAAAAINAFAARPKVIVGCVLIAGKVNYPEAIGQLVRKENPAFVTSAYDCVKALGAFDGGARRRILSRYGLVDGRVHARDSRVEGARNRRSPTIGHLMTITWQLTVGAPSFIRFLKKQTQSI
jgi:pimeloyl-ACP methyl ester carboxylesterase